VRERSFSKLQKQLGHERPKGANCDGTAGQKERQLSLPEFKVRTPEYQPAHVNPVERIEAAQDLEFIAINGGSGSGRLMRKLPISWLAE
jgi:hypothetical protein